MSDYSPPPERDDPTDGEFASFLAEITPILEQGVGRLGVAGSLGARTSPVDPEKIIAAWPEMAYRVVEELR